MRKFLFWMKDERGGIAAMTAIMLAAIVGLLALVVDLGHLQDVKNELQNAADAAALAGARTLMPLSGTGDPPWPMENPPPCTTATQAALDTSMRNQANLKNVYLDPAEVITGNWDYKPVGTRTGTFTPMACGSQTNAVKVTARMRGDLPQGSVTMTFAKIFGFNTVNPSATAIAAIGNLVGILPGTPEAGWLSAPADYLKSIWDNYFENYWSNYSPADGTAKEYWNSHPGKYYYFVLQPAKGSASWDIADNVAYSLPVGNEPSDNANLASLKSIIDGTSAITVPINTGEDGTIMNLNNGEQGSVIQYIQKILNQNGGIIENVLVTGVDTVSYTGTQKALNAYSINITGAWKAGQDIPVEFINQMKANDPSIDPSVFVGVIQFYMTPYQALDAEPGPVDSNIKALTVKLVQ
jgi:hypothetical protein